MLNQRSLASWLPGLALIAALLGAAASPGYCQQADDPVAAAISYQSFRTLTDANGNRVVEIILGGALGETISVVSEKEYRTLAGGGDPNSTTFSSNPAYYAKHYYAQARANFGATDEEWKALSARIMKIQRLRLHVGSHGKQGRAPGEGQSELATAWSALAKALVSKEVKAPEIKPLLEAVNEAETKAKAELKQAEKDLRDLLTVRQEAIMVKMGVLN